MNLRELLDKRAKLVKEARDIIDQAEKEDRGLSDEEKQRYDALMKDAGDLTERIQRLQQQQALEHDLGQSVQDPSRPEPGDGERATPEFVSRALATLSEQRGQDWLDLPEWRRLARTTEQGYEAGFRAYLRNGAMSQEVRALQADSDTLGGYLMTPLQFVDRLIQAVDNLLFIRQWATGYSVPSADALGAPSLDSDPADPTWTSELAIGTEDSSMKFGRRELHPHPLAKYIKLSNTLLRKVPDVEGLVRQRLGYKFAATMENAYLNGDGTQQPLGLFTISNDGISANRDVSTGNTATELRFDGLIEAKYTLKAQYWPRARWIFHRDGVKQLAKLKDGAGQYIWRQSVTMGEPDRVFSFPVGVSEYAPNTFTASKLVGIVGDFSFYWYADALDMQLQRLVELYAATNQTAFIGRMESDGMPVLEEAFVRVKLAAS